MGWQTHLAHIPAQRAGWGADRQDPGIQTSRSRVQNMLEWRRVERSEERSVQSAEKYSWKIRHLGHLFRDHQTKNRGITFQMERTAYAEVIKARTHRAPGVGLGWVSSDGHLELGIRDSPGHWKCSQESHVVWTDTHLV